MSIRLPTMTNMEALSVESVFQEIEARFPFDAFYGNIPEPLNDETRRRIAIYNVIREIDSQQVNATLQAERLTLRMISRTESNLYKIAEAAYTLRQTHQISFRNISRMDQMVFLQLSLFILQYLIVTLPDGDGEDNTETSTVTSTSSESTYENNNRRRNN